MSKTVTGANERDRKHRPKKRVTVIRKGVSEAIRNFAIPDWKGGKDEGMQGCVLSRGG